jgi:hypothetical protein
MNLGVLGFPAHRPEPGRPGIRALVKFDGTAPAGGAGFHLDASAIKLAYNVSRILYNGTGDYTIYFTDPMPTEHFISLLSARQGGGGRGICDINSADLGRADQKRLDIFNATPTPVNSTEVCAVFIA